jgi:predicted component of type VI protein secretion system
MRKLFLVLSLAVLGTGVASVESMGKDRVKGKRVEARTHVFQQGNPGTPQERAEQLTASMTQELSLTADQTAKVKEINLSRFNEQREMRQKARASGDREAVREQMQTMRKKYDDQMKAVLTEEQFAKYEASSTRGQGQMRNGERSGERAGKRSRNI